MKKCFLLLFIFALAKTSFSQLDEGLSFGIAPTYNRILNTYNNDSYGSPGINLRVLGNLGSHHLLVGGFSYYLPTEATFTVSGYSGHYASPTYTTINYTERSKTTEMFLQVFHFIGNENNDDFGFYFHTGLNISFYKEEIIGIDTSITYDHGELKPKSKRSALFLYAGCGTQYKVGPGYIFLEPKLGIPIPVGSDYRSRQRIPIGVSLGYRFCFDD